MSNEITSKERNYVLAVVENEGFDYAFNHYSDFEEIKDEEFHQLRKNFLEARQKLAQFIGFDN